VVNEAALLAARKDKSMVDMTDFDDAKDKVLMGVERRSMVISEEEKKNTAYHEAGHTLVAKLIPGTDPIHKVSIIPRGMALGVTMQLPTEDKHSYSREVLLNRIAVLMGGRAAEEIIFNSKTTGAGNDIERATEIARKMVCEWGMSDTLGPVTFGKKDEQIFLGREMATHKNYSEATAVEIDAEIRHIVDDSYKRVLQLLNDKIDILHRLSLELYEKENLSGAEVDMIVMGEVSPESPEQPEYRP
jgi:cell division protease FtsH